MTARDDGGPAFPAPDLGELDFGQRGAYPGMTLRDYFAAHAPAEPQHWFKPSMPPEPVADFVYPAGMTEAERAEWNGYGDYLDSGDLKEPRIRDYYAKREAFNKAHSAWDAERRIQRCIQWPYAWADAQLAERARTA